MILLFDYQHMIALLLLPILLTASFTPYTNQQALSCFQDKALDLCENHFKLCLKREDCQKELQLFFNCGFGKTTNQTNQIFNGYCFRRWQQKADSTKNFISCINDACDLTYNSEIGSKQLFDCSQWIMFEHQVQCGEQCGLEVQQKIKKNFYLMPFVELYSQQFADPEAQSFANLILKECIRDGSGKAMIYEEERLKEQTKSGSQGNKEQQDSMKQEATGGLGQL